MNYDEMLQHSEASDHGRRIVSELEQAIKESFANTSIDYPALEIGNRDGGSAIVAIYYIGLVEPRRKFVSVDSGACPARITEWTGKLGIPHQHFQMPQADFVKDDKTEWGFIFLDADHGYETVKRDMEILAPRLAKGGMMVVDDVHEWPELPVIEGLERIELKVDEGDRDWSNTKTGHHIAFWRKL